MHQEAPSDRIASELTPIVEGMGYSLVEGKSMLSNGMLHVHLVIYRPDGVTLEDCSKVHKTVQARLEVVENTENIHIEVASPGTERTLKTVREFEIFRGKGARIMRKETNQWEEGIIESVDDRQVCLRKGETETCIPHESIRKARLDYTQEVG